MEKRKIVVEVNGEKILESDDPLSAFKWLVRLFLFCNSIGSTHIVPIGADPLEFRMGLSMNEVFFPHRCEWLSEKWGLEIDPDHKKEIEELIEVLEDPRYAGYGLAWKITIKGISLKDLFETTEGISIWGVLKQG